PVGREDHSLKSCNLDAFLGGVLHVDADLLCFAEDFDAVLQDHRLRTVRLMTSSLDM
ncbi:MAG: hypothetical protein RL011_1997, partial [Pseudomonadota bacterium]